MKVWVVVSYEKKPAGEAAGMMCAAQLKSLSTVSS